MSFAQTIKQIRKDRGWTQGEVSDMLGIKSATLASYEEGRAYPRFLDLKKFIEVYQPEDVCIFLFGEPIELKHAV